ncbi:hypothetical protein GTW20_08790 [Nocardiopsis alba]|uniref:DUF4190 domain-containing protein n=1 Tax=Nocardiopsis alba TaxID=53437 RepID=A0A7K2IR20_9ACTN|nr:hypothetical protein [Nocardiopsis alba]MYR32363.1 hypothetical protein [Nocardiopsis alba]
MSYGPPHDPYGGQGPGYPPPPGHFHSPYPVPPPKGGAIAALVVSVLLVISCYGIFAAVGLIFSIMALSEQYDHEKVSRFTRYAWIANGVVIGLLVLFFVGIIVFAVLTS